MIGKTGSGKSMLCIDLLIQTLAYYGFTVILDEGFSYQCYAQLCHPDSKPVVIEPNGGSTFNYLDTRGLPISSMQIADASAMALLLVGHHADEDRNRLRLAHLVHGINQLYQDTYEQWRNDRPEIVERVARHALAIQQWHRERMPSGANFVDAFVSFRDWSVEHPDEAESLFEEFEEEAVSRMMQAEDESTSVLRDLSFAYMSPDKMPTHRQFQELMSMPTGQGKEAEEIKTLATFLEPWCSYGNYGPLLDGVSNVSLDSSLAHFEFGCIPESARELRSVASFLITNYVRNEIMKRPRGLRKRVILEELSAFLMNREGERITQEFFERMRKYNCWVLAIIQQYARLCESPVRKSVMGNIRSAYILKQRDREEVDLLGDALGLQEVTKQAILNFPEPASMGNNAYSSFVYYEAKDHRPTIAIGRHVASAEMLYTSASSGEHVDQRNKALRGSEDVSQSVLGQIYRSNN